MGEDQLQTDSSTLWIDVSTLLRWEGKVTGIPRVVSQYVDLLSKQPGLRERLCAFNACLRVYEEVPLRAVPRPAPAQPTCRPAASRPSWRSALRDRFRPLYRVLPTDLQHFCREGFSALRYLARFLVRSGGRSLMNLSRSLLYAAVRLVVRRPARPLFADGDVLFMPGASWDDFGACDALARIKQTQRLYVVPFIHDVIPAKLPHVVAPLLAKLFDPWIRKLLRLSDLVLTNSHFSRGDLIAEAAGWGVPVPPIEVVRLGDAPAGFDRPARPAGLPRSVESFALSVGTFEIRKNHWLLYQTWRRLIEECGDRVPPLVLAGRPGWGTRDLLVQMQTDPLVRDRIVVLFDVTDEELSWLYRNCLFTLYPSFYEGWGLPVAESLAHGKHCVCSSATSVPEVGGDLADYHDPLDGTRLMDLVRRVLFEPGYREGREERIRRASSAPRPGRNAPPASPR